MNSNMNHNSFFHCVSQIRRKTFLLLEGACLLIQTNLLSNHSITPLFCSDNGLYRGLLKSVTADLGGDTGEAISVDKPSTEQDDLKGAKALLFFNVPREQEAKLEVSPPTDRGVRGGWRERDPFCIVVAIWSSRRSVCRSSIILSDKRTECEMFTPLISKKTKRENKGKGPMLSDLLQVNILFVGSNWKLFDPLLQVIVGRSASQWFRVDWCRLSQIRKQIRKSGWTFQRQSKTKDHVFMDDLKVQALRPGIRLFWM